VFARLGADRFRHPNSVFHAALAPDGKTLASAALGSVSVFETATGKLLRRVEKAGVPFHQVAFTADGKTLYAVAGPNQDGCELLTIDPATGKERSRLVIRKRIYRGAEFSPDATRLAVSFMWEYEAVLFDPASGKELVRMPAQSRGNGFTPDGKSLILAGGNEVIRVIDANTGKETSKLEPKDSRPEWVRFTPGGAVLFAGHHEVERWDPKRKVP
jgi:WD40 repeat protein